MSKVIKNIQWLVAATKKNSAKKMNKDNIPDFPRNIIKLYTKLPRTPSFLFKRRKIPLKISEEISCA